MIKRIFDSIVYRYNRKFQSNIHKFISAIDLMQPINGRITAAQVVIITRLLDIELIRQGQQSYWDVRLSSLCQNLSDEEKVAFRKQSEGIVHSMDKYGWDFNLSSVMVNREPLFVYNGTHRMAYSLQKNPFHLLPVFIDFDGWDWSREDGLVYWGNKGLTLDELQAITHRYELLIKDYVYDYQIILAEKNEDIIERLNNISKVNSIKNYIVHIKGYPSWLSKQDKKFFKAVNNGCISVIRFTTINKDLSFECGEFRSPVIEKIIKSIGIKQYTYTPTITKSIEMDIWLKENCKEIN